MEAAKTEDGALPGFSRRAGSQRASMKRKSSVKYNWKETNLEHFGSDLELATKIQASEYEMAWKGAGEKEGLLVWRIVNFKVESWPKEDYGKFYDGDSYIILNTHKSKESPKLLHDVHFWIGKFSTQDEYGTAAYKTVELDDYLARLCVQHREVQGYESDLFKSYFDSLTYLQGGAESGFRAVKPEMYEPRLLHFHGDRKKVIVSEILRNAKLLDDTDVYILDLGLMLYQWNGRGSNKDERHKAMEYIWELKELRGGKCRSEVLDQESTGSNHEFFDYLDEEYDPVFEEDKFKSAGSQTTEENDLFRLTDSSGDLCFSLEKSGKITRKDLDGNDVFIVDTRIEVFVWIGGSTTSNERKNALKYAHKYLLGTGHPFIPITCLEEAVMEEVEGFVAAMAA